MNASSVVPVINPKMTNDRNIPGALSAGGGSPPGLTERRVHHASLSGCEGRSAMRGDRERDRVRKCEGGTCRIR